MSADERFIAVLSLAGVDRDYRGMDGHILKSSDNRQDVEGSFAGPLEANLDLYDLMSLRQLHVVAESSSSAGETEHRLGWDVGHLNDWGSTYSLIIHYLLNNRPGSRADYTLNNNLLFASASDARRLLDEWIAWRPEDPRSKETFIEEDRLDIWAVSELGEPTDERPAVWTVKFP